MTSKNLFFKLMLEDGKQRLWSFVLAMIVFFFALPVVGAFMLSATLPAASLSKQMTWYLTDGNILFFIITFVGAMICGVSGFSYLQSRKKVDFYHGIPVRREMMFAISYLNGILIYIIPFLTNLCLYLAIAAGKSLTPDLLFRNAFAALALHLIYYLVLYTVAVAAVMLTGNQLACVLACLLLYFYGFLVQCLNLGYHSYFYSSFWAQDSLFCYEASPVTAYVKAAGNLRDSLEYWGFPWGNLAEAAVVWLAAAALSLFLYRQRPSEAAEKAVAFTKTKPVIYFLVSVPMSLTGGLMFASMAEQYSNAWMIFGMICSWLLTHGLLQIIMESEFRAIFQGGVKMAVAGAAAAVITAVFAFDLTGYNAWLPSESRFYSAAIGCSGLNGNIYIEDKEGEDLYRYNVPIRQMSYTDYQSLKALVEETEEFQKERGGQVSDAAGTDQEKGSADLFVKYCLKNGKTVYRRYRIETEKRELMNRVFMERAFKEGSYPVLTRPESEIGNAYFYNGIGTSVLVDIPYTDLLQLFRTFCEEYRTLSLYDMEELPFGMLTFAKKENVGEPGYYIYPSMTKTIGLLEKAGMESRQQAAGKQDVRITISPSYMFFGIKEADLMQQEPLPEAVYTGKQAEELLAVTAPYEWFSDNSMAMPREEVSLAGEYSISVSGGGRDEYGNEIFQDYSFARGKVPEFVREDLKLDEIEELYRKRKNMESEITDVTE